MFFSSNEQTKQYPQSAGKYGKVGEHFLSDRNLLRVLKM